MLLNKTENLSLWPCLHLAHLTSFSSWNSECILCRIGGMIILSLSIICLIYNIRYFIWYQQKRCRNTLVFSLFVASFLVLTIGVPGILLQLFTCSRHCHEIYCRIEGFTSYLGGCLCMLIYMILSINRYLILYRCDHPLLYRYSALFCWILSISWTLPPAFGYWISYVPEGLGFHCSINWNEHSQTSFYYILFSFVIFYFFPLIIIFTMNLRVHQIIRTIFSSQNLYLNQKIFNQKNQQKLDDRSRITISYIHRAADRKRLRIQYRFVRAIIFLVSTYILAWTPYSIIALLQLFHVDFIFQYGIFITLSAFIAKISVISAPLVYLSIMNNCLFKQILFQQ